MRYLFCFAALAIAVSQASAQTAPGAFPRPGAAVRVTNMKADTVFGLVVGQSADSLWLSGRRFSHAEITSIATLEKDRAKGARKGLKWGAGIGVALIVGGLISDAKADPCQDIVCISATATGSVLAVLSTTLGAVIGAASAPTEWRRVK